MTPNRTVVAAMASQGFAQLKAADFEFESESPIGIRSVNDFVGPGTLVAWSPDGRFLATAPQWLGTFPRAPLSGEQGTLRFNLVAADSDEVKTVSSDLEYGNEMEWMPDSSALIVAGVDLRGGAGLYTVDVTTGQTTKIASTSGQREQPAWPTKWSPVVNGRIYYQRNLVDKAEATFWEHDLSTGAEQQVLGRAAMFSDSPPEAGPFRTVVGVTAGRDVVYVTNTGRREIAHCECCRWSRAKNAN